MSTSSEHDDTDWPEFGASMPPEDTTLDDILRHPIWVLALDEETVEGQDETWQKPVTNTKDLSRYLERNYICTITLKVVGTEIYGCGDYDHTDGALGGIAVWHDGAWKTLKETGVLEAPLEFEAVPSIFGEPGVRFVCHDLLEPEVPRADGKRSRSIFAFFRRLIP